MSRRLLPRALRLLQPRHSTLTTLAPARHAPPPALCLPAGALRSPPWPTGTAASASRLPLALALLAAAAAGRPARAEAPPLAPRAPQTWPELLRTLQDARHRHPPLAPFTAARRPLDDPPRGASHQTPWLFELEFPTAPHADLFTLLAILAAALQPAAPPELAVDDTPTRTVLRLSAPHSFRLELTVPRLGALEPRVALTLQRAGADATFAPEEVDALLRAYALASPAEPVSGVARHLLDGRLGVDVGPPTALERPRAPREPRARREHAEGDVVPAPVPRAEGSRAARRARAKLEELGVDVFDGEGSALSWDALAGYDDVKRRIDDTLTLPLRHPDIYESVVRGTRQRFESNLPKAVLYEGPPGCGKTLSAKILAASIGVPFVHVPLETILSKFYGETTRKLAEILQTANDLGPCLVFIDECDSIGMSRSSSTDVHEVTRRTLSVLLRHIDGLDGPQNTILLAATNHKEDIDPALMSRFDVVVTFPLPDLATRIAVLALYAKHLSQPELKAIAEMSACFSGRELLDVCEEAERTHAGRIVREHADGKVEKKGVAVVADKLPVLAEYVEAVKRKAPHVVGRKEKTPVRPNSRSRPLAMGPSKSISV